MFPFAAASAWGSAYTSGATSRQEENVQDAELRYNTVEKAASRWFVWTSAFHLLSFPKLDPKIGPPVYPRDAHVLFLCDDDPRNDGVITSAFGVAAHNAFGVCKSFENAPEAISTLAISKNEVEEVETSVATFRRQYVNQTLREAGTPFHVIYLDWTTTIFAPSSIRDTLSVLIRSNRIPASGRFVLVANFNVDERCLAWKCWARINKEILEVHPTFADVTRALLRSCITEWAPWIAWIRKQKESVVTLFKARDEPEADGQTFLHYLLEHVSESSFERIFYDLTMSEDFEQVKSADNAHSDNTGRLPYVLLALPLKGLVLIDVLQSVIWHRQLGGSLRGH
jgi:hypothetical protein